MIERSDATIHLMESLYNSAIPDLIHENKVTQREFTQQFLEGRAKDSHLDLALTPDFLRNPDNSVTDTVQQEEIANEVLASLHEAWRGGEKLEHNPNPNLTEKYWEFIDNDFISYTVVEMHGNFGLKNSAHVKAYIVRDPRPKTYQDLLNKQEEKLRGDDSKHDQQIITSEIQKVSRFERIGKRVTKWWREQPNQPRDRYRL